MDITLMDGGIERRAFMISTTRLATSAVAEPMMSITWTLWPRPQPGKVNLWFPRPKNVTILGLPSLPTGLHIVCPKDSQRYYLLFTRIHKLFAPLFTSVRTLLKT
jgi:hypothetical protein